VCTSSHRVDVNKQLGHGIEATIELFAPPATSTFALAFGCAVRLAGWWFLRRIHHCALAHVRFGLPCTPTVHGRLARLLVAADGSTVGGTAFRIVASVTFSVVPWFRGATVREWTPERHVNAGLNHTYAAVL